MEFDFLTPVDFEVIQYVEKLSNQNLGRKVAFHTDKDFPDLQKIKIAIIGFLENRGDDSFVQEFDLNQFRKEFYSLFPGNWQSSIADLGDIHPGNSLDDTYFAVQRVVSRLLKSNILPIIIGGTQDLTYPLYRSYDKLEQMVNLVSIDSKFDFGKQDISLPVESYLSKIIIDEPNNLFNYCNVGFQTYLNSQEEMDLVDKMYFDAYRLGDISNNISLAEPVLRDADLVSVDMNCVMSAYTGNTSKFVANGFDGKEICALARYAGISDKVTSFGLFNFNASYSESVLVAQIIWYFIEGYNFRSNEYPFGSKELYSRYIVPLETEELIFYKSNKTERWWIEIPFFSTTHNKLKKNTLLPCSYEEYLMACNHEIPERWWKAQRKNIL